ncbi:MAG: Xaa-Pro peptidase family protein [Pseudomonadota bacterium]
MTRGFPEAEYQVRLRNAQQGMAEVGISALLLTGEADLRYFSGFLTRFWESPCRPWYLIVPAAGTPVAVIPQIGRHLMHQTWLRDIRTWDAPADPDDGLDLLVQALRDVCGSGGRVAFPDRQGSTFRMPLGVYRRLLDDMQDTSFVSDGGLVAGLRQIKSAAEIDKIETACAIASRAFSRVHEIAKAGCTLEEVFRKTQQLCLQEGADWVPYLAGACGPGGYGDVISPASAQELSPGDVLMLDIGLVWDGYFCDFDRNFAIGPADPATQAAHRCLIDAVDAAVEILRPGCTLGDVHAAMAQVLTTGHKPLASGRLGHGLGMQLTEGLSILPGSDVEVAENMVLTLEPVAMTGPDRIMVHEENIVVKAQGCRFLSKRSGTDIKVLEGSV